MADLSTYLANALLDHLLGVTASYTSPAAVYIGLSIGDPDEGGTEVSGGSYARQAITFAAPSGGAVLNDALVTFPTATADWGTITHVGIWDAASGGNLLVRFVWSVGPTLVTSGQTVSFPASTVSISFDSGGMSDYTEAAVLNHVFRNITYSPLPIYVALHTADPGDAGAGAEVSGGGYARILGLAAPAGALAANKRIGLKADGTGEFPAPTAAWGTVTHVGLWDAAVGGNLLWHAPLDGGPYSVGIDEVPYLLNTKEGCSFRIR